MDWRSFHVTERTLLRLVAFVPPAVMLAVVALRQITIFGEWEPVGWTTAGYVLAWYLVLLVATFWAARAVPSCEAGGLHKPISVNSIIPIFSLIALLGACILTYEFAVGRSYGFDTSVNDIRVLQVNNAGSGFVGTWRGGLGRVLVAALPVAWFAACMRWKDVKRGSLAILALSTAGVFAYQAKFEGGRFFFTALILACLFACLLHLVKDSISDSKVRLANLRFLHLQPLIVLIVLFIGMSAYNSYVFVSRGEYTASKVENEPPQGEGAGSSQGDKNEPGEVASQPDKTEPGEAASQPYETKPGETDELQNEFAHYAGIYKRFAAYFPIDVENVSPEGFDQSRLQMAMTWIYATHGLSHFDLVMQRQDFVHAYGFFQFSQLGQVFSKLLGTDLRYNGHLPIDGAYIPLPGAAYVDFGFLGGLLMAAVLGAALGYTTLLAFRRSSPALEFIAPIIMIFLIFGPVASVVPSFWPSIVWIAVIYVLERNRALWPQTTKFYRGTDRATS